MHKTQYIKFYKDWFFIILFFFRQTFLWVCLPFIVISCKHQKSEINQEENVIDFTIDTSAVPSDTIVFPSEGVAFENGNYLLHGKKYSGIVYKLQKGYDIATYSSVLDGKLHGTFRSFYANGKPFEVRHYKHNQSHGKQIGYWESTGKLKTEYFYNKDEKEGVQKNWYVDGQPLYTYLYHHDVQVGLQQAWRQNGSLFRNYIVKNGVSYGLQKPYNCYEISDGKVVDR